MTDVHPIAAPWGRFALFSYLIDAPELALVDTGVTASAANVPAELEKLGRSISDVRWILLTHGHIDHVGGAHALWEATGRQAKVVISEIDAPFLRSRQAHVEEALELRGAYVGAAALRAKKSDEVLEAISGEMEPHLAVRDGDTLDLGGIHVRVVATPGHTAGAVAYVVESGDGAAEHVFVGDAAQCYGAASGFPGYEDPATYRASLERIVALEPQHLYLGHPYRRVDQTPFPVVLDADGAHEALTGSLTRESEIRDAIGRITQNLPDDADAPQIVKADSDSSAIMRLAVTSSTLNMDDLTLLVENEVVDRLASVDGVADVEEYGDQEKVFRVDVDQSALASRGLTVGDLTEALDNAALDVPAGSLKSTTQDIVVRATANLKTPADFENVILQHNVRLGDVATVTLGPPAGSA